MVLCCSDYGPTTQFCWVWRSASGFCSLPCQTASSCWSSAARRDRPFAAPVEDWSIKPDTYDAKAVPMPGRIWIGLPAYNEEIALPRLLARIEGLRKISSEPITVVLYNDGSTDATLATTRAWQHRLPLVILDGVVNKGLSAGLRALVEYAAANARDEDALVVMDCDDTHDPAQIAAMRARMAEGADVVVGSRYVRGARVQGVPLLRRITALGNAARRDLFAYVEGYYNRRRLHSAIGYITPEQAEAKSA
jgi:glycosyltransferase involved in cell wall biosynthesis